VLAGSGSWENELGSWQVRAGDCAVRLVQDQGHLLRAGSDGLTVLAFVSPVARKLVSAPTTRKPNIVKRRSDRGRLRRGLRKVGGGRQEGRCSARGSQLGPPRAREERRASAQSFGRRGGLRSSSKGVGRWSSGRLRLVQKTRSAKSTRFAAGDVVWRPPSTGISHFLRAATRTDLSRIRHAEPNDVCYYPRSNKIYWPGSVSFQGWRHWAYDDGEPEE